MKLVSYGATLVLALALNQMQESNATALKEKNPVHATCVTAPAPSQDDTEGDEVTAAEVLVDFATAVDVLLRDLAAQMQVIAANVEAGDLTPAEAVTLKLQTTRAMIAHLETISAVVDAVVFSDEDTKADNPEPNCPSLLSARARAMPHARRVISVKELMRENSQ
jgi:hypothetical protein